VAKFSTSARYLLSLAGAVAAASIISGCSGSSAVTPAGATQVNPMLGMTPAHSCRHHGAVVVDVDPCSIDFTSSNAGPFNVTVNARESKKGTFTESDNCGGASGIATLAPGSGDQWIVTAGATTGSCTAVFSFQNKRGKTVGTADLGITNSI
jgi:hypothetical protein